MEISIAMTIMVTVFTFTHLYFPGGNPLANQSKNFLKGYKINFKSFFNISTPKLF